MAFPARRGAWLRSHASPLLVLAVCVSTTLALAFQVHSMTHAKDAIRFNITAERVQNDLTQRLDTYLAMLHAGAGLLAANPDVRADQFRAFAARLELQRRYPGIQGIGFSRRVGASELAAFTARHRAADPSFHPWPETPRSEYHSIVFLEPLDRRNRAAIGYDMATEPVRRAAMVRARDTAQPAASGRVTLVQEIDQRKQAGFLIYLPGYAGGDVPASVEERRSRLSGFIYSPFRVGDLLAGIFGTEEQPRVGFELYDEAPSAGGLLFRSAGFDPGARFTDRRYINVSGRRWALSLSGTPALEDASSRGLVPLVAIAGLLVSALLTTLTALQTRARRRLEQSEATLSDVLDRERALRAEAERVSRIKDEFLATLSHELRTPLNAIIGWNHLLIEGHIPEETRRRALATVQRNARLQARLIDDLLDMSRIVAGKVRLDTREVDMNEIVEAAVNVVRPAASAKRISVEAAPDRGSPRVVGDPGRLQQVLWNLLTNAVKFTPEGGRVQVRIRHTDSEIHVTVADTGSGLDPGFQPYVFDRFRQADGSSTRQHGGLGLGLSIVKSLIEMHGGTVHAASEGVGRGAAFTVVLRAASTSSPDAASLDNGRSRQSAFINGGEGEGLTGARILVVENDHDARELARTILEQHGAIVVAVSSADEALRAMDDGAPAVNLIVSDLGMPGKDGFELVREVRCREAGAAQRTPAVALSAYARAEDRAKSAEAGFDAHVAKPFQPADLVSTCVEVLRIWSRDAPAGFAS